MGVVVVEQGVFCVLEEGEVGDDVAGSSSQEQADDQIIGVDPTEMFEVAQFLEEEGALVIVALWRGHSVRGAPDRSSHQIPASRATAAAFRALLKHTSDSKPGEAT